MDLMILAPSKPAWADDCNGCGRCCLAQQCEASQLVHGKIGDANCPELSFDGRVYRCAMIADEFVAASAKSGVSRWLLNRLAGGVGRGCGCPDDVELDLIARMEKRP